MPWLPRHKFMDWPADAVEKSTADIIELYKNGFAGAKPPTEKVIAEFYAQSTYPNAEDAVHRFGLADTGAGKLVVPFVLVMEMFPGCWPGAKGQGRGDCVSWSTRNGCLMTAVCDIASGQPDEKSGKPEEKPEVPPEGVADGVFSTESFYWYRGYDGDGWFCQEAATVAARASGLVVRKNYPDLGVDLTGYSARTAGKYGRQSPPENIQAVGKEHLIHETTAASTLEACRDLLFNGYGLTTCGGEGYSDRRNEHGVSERSGSWAHAYGRIGVDDRDVIKQIYGEPLALELNSWAKWNSGPRDIYQSAALVPPAKREAWIQLGIVSATTGNIMIPEGAWWCKWSTARRRDVYGFSGAHGWPAKKLPDIDWSQIL